MSATSRATPAWTPDAIARRVEQLRPWFHNLDLAGVRTAPGHFLGDYPNVKWQRFAAALPADLAGKTVLDIGCNAGFYALQMKARGAARVVALDTETRYLDQARFAAEVAGCDIEFLQMSVYDIGALREQFDLVIFMGVLYHLRHPLLALDLIYENVARDLLLFQSMLRGSKQVAHVEPDYEFWDSEHFEDPGYPALHFVEKRYADDPTNWWIPNRACAEAMLRSAGFDIVSHPEEEVYLCRRRDRRDYTVDYAAYPTKHP